MNVSTLHILRDKLLGEKAILAFPHIKKGNDLFYEIHRGNVTDIDYYEILYVTLDDTRVYSFSDGEGGYKLYDDNHPDYAKNYINFFTGEQFNLTRL